MQVKYIAECILQILSTFIKLPFVIKINFLSIFEWPFYIGFTVHVSHFENSVCPDQVASEKPADQDPDCFPLYMKIHASNWNNPR